MKKSVLLVMGALLVLGACSSNSEEGKKCTCLKMQCDHAGSAGITIVEKKKAGKGGAGIVIKQTKKEAGSAGIKIKKK